VINRRFAHHLPRLLVVVALAATAACGTHTRGTVPAGTTEPDKFLFDKGTVALGGKKWLTAREFFKQVTETYTASPYRPDAKLGIGDTYLGEGTAEALVLAINEFREFLSFYPTHRRADYAQYKLGMAHFRQMRHAQRDQTETREAVKEFEAFVARYPTSSLMPEVKARLRESRDRLSEADYLVGYFYYRRKSYTGAIERFGDVAAGCPIPPCSTCCGTASLRSCAGGNVQMSAARAIRPHTRERGSLCARILRLLS